MSKKVYTTTICTCDRCGEEKMFEYYNDHYNEGWRGVPGEIDEKLLCPDCVDLYLELVKKFMTCKSFSVTAGVKLGEEECDDENSI